MITLDAIARPRGTFAMVAMDQRESLRHMFDLVGRGRVDDDTLVDFKVAVASELGPHASGFLMDRRFGLDRVRAVLPASTGLIVAADELDQADGGPVEETGLDEAAITDSPDDAVAAKLLIIWRRDRHRDARIALADRFIRRARERGLLSVLEPVVRPSDADRDGWDLDEAIREAARELSAIGPDLYKAQVPLAGEGDERSQRSASAALNEAVATPWVVLSQGVAQERFEGAVRSACLEGASGFLAGRALWSDVVGATDTTRGLRGRSVPRLRSLIDTVDEVAQPWSAS